MIFVVILLNLLLYYICALKPLSLLQQRGYKYSMCRKMTKYVATILCLIILIMNIITLFVTIVTNNLILCLCYSIIILLICVCIRNYYYKSRVLFKFTGRGIRLVAVHLLIGASLSLSVIFIENTRLSAILLPVLSALSPLILFISNAVCLPYERARNKAFVERAKAELDTKDVIRIGITGSFGKTGCKNILLRLLSRNYNVVATPESYNTPLGIAKTVESIIPATDIFIAELGARRRGDIAELCELVKPGYGIITGVTKQHLETFKTVENIYREKYSLAEKLTGNSLCVFNGENAYSNIMYSNYRKPKVRVGFDKGDVRAENIKIGENGCEFCLCLNGFEYKVRTKLLGKHNIINILLCVAIATKLGVSDKDIVEIIETLEPVKHRMELIRTGNITIIDDSYNANPEGVKYALETLKEFPGRKLSLSQGIVELGEEGERINTELGESLAEASDVLILCGSNAGYMEKGAKRLLPQKECYVCKGLSEAEALLKKLLKSGDVLLLQNDLPDIY